MEFLPGSRPLLVAYLLGSIPSGLLVGKLVYGIDVREHGSHCTGTTNVLRTVGKGAREPSSCWTSQGRARRPLRPLAPPTEPCGPTGGPPWRSPAGHNWPLFSGFQGGRGVVVSGTALGVMYPPALLVLILVGLWSSGAPATSPLGSVCRRRPGPPC